MFQTTQRKKMPLWAVIALDLLALGAALVVFALFHHVIPRAAAATEERRVSATPVPTEAALPTPGLTDRTQAEEPLGLPEETEEPEESEEPEEKEPETWAERFAEHFTAETVIAEGSYTSPNVSVTVTMHEQGEGNRKNTYYVADIYVTDVRCFRSYLAKNTYGSGIVQNVLDMARDSGAIAAMTGDMYAYQGASLMLRNGELYRDGRWQSSQSHCALYYDGTMQVYEGNEIDLEQALADGAWQIWSFGPVLLRDGEMPERFGSGMAVENANPRAAVGYYEPGHYCFVVVDGRRTGYSYGMTFGELAQLFADLGCTTAYNLDGGGSAVLTMNGEIANQPSGGGRYLSDIMLIAEPPEEEEETEK